MRAGPERGKDFTSKRGQSLTDRWRLNYDDRFREMWIDDDWIDVSRGDPAEHEYVEPQRCLAIEKYIQAERS